MRAAEIETQDDLKAWLEGQSQEVCVWIAARAFAQKLPLYWSETALAVGKGQDSVELLTFYKSLLTALTFAHAKNDNVKARLGSAATQVTSAANPAAKAAVGVLGTALIDAFFVAQATAVAAEAAENASAVAKTRAFVDAQWAEAEGVTEARRLWAEEMPEYTMAALHAMLDALPDADGDQPDYRSFWVPWYQGLLDGKPAFPQALTEAVALIDEADWKQGDLHINNTVIPRLMAELGARDAVRGERILRNSSGVLVREPVTELPEDIRARAVSRTLEALEDLRGMSGQGGNQLYAIFLPSADVIGNAVERAGKNSVRLFETLQDATTRISRIAAENGLDEDGEVAVVLANFERSRNEIWNGDPQVRAVQTAPPGRSPDDLPPGQQQALEDTTDLIADEADSDLQDAIAQDWGIAKNSTADTIERRRALQRIAGRSLQAMNIWLEEKSSRIERIKRIAAPYGWLGGWLLFLWTVLLGGGAP